MVIRDTTNPVCTLGGLYINGSWQCHTIEDTYHPVKIYGETRIPSGYYDLGLRTEGGMHQDYSSRFQFHRGMIHILDVPEFEWVYIHIANYASELLGCIGVGMTRGDNAVQSSVRAYSRIYPQIADGIEDGECKLLIGDPVELMRF